MPATTEHKRGSFPSCNSTTGAVSGSNLTANALKATARSNYDTARGGETESPMTTSTTSAGRPRETRFAFGASSRREYLQTRQQHRGVSRYSLDRRRRQRSPPVQAQAHQIATHLYRSAAQLSPSHTAVYIYSPSKQTPAFVRLNGGYSLFIGLRGCLANSLKD